MDSSWDRQLLNDIVCALHDVGQNVRMIAWHALVIQRDPSATESVRASAEHIAGHVKHLIPLFEEVVASAKGKSRKDLFFSSVLLPADLEDLLAVFRVQALSKGLAFTAHFADSVPEAIYTDVACLRRILSNLLTNAVKFTPAGAVAIEFDYQNDVLEVSVSDTGQGIAVERQSEIFWPFNRGLSQQQEGTGLGLFGAKVLANRMGGDLNLVKSSLGEGSVFRAMIINRKESRTGHAG